MAVSVSITVLRRLMGGLSKNEGVIKTERSAPFPRIFSDRRFILEGQGGRLRVRTRREGPTERAIRGGFYGSGLFINPIGGGSGRPPILPKRRNEGDPIDVPKHGTGAGATGQAWCRCAPSLSVEDGSRDGPDRL